MRWMILRRIVLLVITVFGVTVFTFLMMHLTPGDPATVIAEARYGLGDATAEELAWIREHEGLDKPVHIQYVTWLSHLVRGDLGNSLISGKPVLDEILVRFPATLLLAAASMFVSLFVSLPLGLISAWKKNSAVDYVSMTGALVGASMPNFWLALLLILFFSLYLDWLPVYGYGDIGHLILPALTMGTGIAAMTTRLTRSSMLEVLDQNYIRTARAKGLRERLVIGKHAFKNAMIPVITIIGLQFATLLEGAVVVETVFAWPGIGRLLVDAIFDRDFAIIQGCALFIAFIFVVVNLLVDISYAWLDPRIRYERR